MNPELTMATIATFRCLLQTSQKHVIIRLELYEDEHGDTIAAIKSQFSTLVDPVGGKIPLQAQGRSASEALGNLETLLQQWY